jgi:predicted ferric reductase
MILASSLATWYLTRGTGFVALILLTASVAMGVLTTAGWSSQRWPRLVTISLHRNVSLVAVVFLLLHIATTVVDGFAPIGWLDAVIPFRSPYRPLWLGLGAVAVDLMLAIVITSLLRRHLSATLWRTVHWTAWLSWPVAVLHSLGTGSDSMNGWGQIVYVACAAIVIAAAWWRVAIGRSMDPRLRISGLVASILVPLLIAVWAVNGPLQHGWARRAGTPTVENVQGSGTP